MNKERLRELLGKAIVALLGQEPAVDQKIIDETLLDELIAHVTDKHHKELYRIVINEQIRMYRAQVAAHTKTCPECDHPIEETDGVEQLLPRLAVKVLDNLMILGNFIGIQPMQGPVGLVYTLQYKNAKGGRLSLEVVSQAVEAMSRKLVAGWTIEAKNDLLLSHGIDIELEILNALASEIANDIIEEHLSVLRSYNKKSGALPVEKFDREDMSKSEWLTCTIIQKASYIAQQTRRGAGNFVIVSPIILSVLEKSTAYEKNKSKEIVGPAGILYVGTLNDSIKVYSSLYGEDSDVLVGYKGGNGETDVGYIFCPYVLLMNSGIVVDEKTFQPHMGMMTRYGVVEVKRANKYYSTFTVDFNDD